MARRLRRPAPTSLDALRTRVLVCSPLAVGLFAGGVALAFVLLRLVVAADGDITRFVVAGDLFVDGATVTDETGADLHVFAGAGYDGQFFWRLAADPTAWGSTHDGIRFDNAYRPPRIGFPLLAWVASAGRAGAVAAALVAVNVAAVGAAGYAAGRLARLAGQPAVRGLLVVAAPGLVLALGRDLAECVTVACVLGGLVALRRDRVLGATGLWSFAVVTREQAFVTIAAYGLFRVVTLVRGRRRPATRGPGGGPPRPGRRDLPWLVPGLVYVGWQLVLWRSIGELPAGAAGGSNIVPPFSDMLPGLVGWARGDLPHLHWIAPLQLAGTIALVVAAVVRLRPPGRTPVPAPAGDRPADAAPAVDDDFLAIALGVAVLAGSCLAASVWRDPSDLRHLVDVSAYAGLVVATTERPVPRWAVVTVAAVWALTIAARIVTI